MQPGNSPEIYPGNGTHGEATDGNGGRTDAMGAIPDVSIGGRDQEGDGVQTMTELEVLIERDNQNLVVMDRLEKAAELVRKAILTVEEVDDDECKALAVALGMIQTAMKETVSRMHRETAEIEDRMEGMRDDR